MSTAIVVLLLLGFSLCVTVGLLSVLQNLVNGDYADEPVSLSRQGQVDSER